MMILSIGPSSGLFTPSPTLDLAVLFGIMSAILFLQSGLDKVFNYKGNKEWLVGHFEKSPLKGSVPLLLPLITLLETFAGILCVVGVIGVFAGLDSEYLIWGQTLACLSIISLFFGQRLAQDYEGAGNLVPYFIMCAVGLYLAQGPSWSL
jgi:uncharacterized membrane protein YphA (DoxX/SURF4 family)